MSFTAGDHKSVRLLAFRDVIAFGQWLPIRLLRFMYIPFKEYQCDQKITYFVFMLDFFFFFKKIFWVEKKKSCLFSLWPVKRALYTFGKKVGGTYRFQRGQPTLPCQRSGSDTLKFQSFCFPQSFAAARGVWLQLSLPFPLSTHAWSPQRLKWEVFVGNIPGVYLRRARKIWSEKRLTWQQVLLFYLPCILGQLPPLQGNGCITCISVIFPTQDWECRRVLALEFLNALCLGSLEPCCSCDITGIALTFFFAALLCPMSLYPTPIVVFIWHKDAG